MTVATFVAPDNTSQAGDVYKNAIDAASEVLTQVAGIYAPHEAATPDMTVIVDGGKILTGQDVVVNGQQTSATIVAPSADPRIDRVVGDLVTGVISIITGTEAASPLVPTIIPGRFPICQILLATDTTEITNVDITDERTGGVSDSEIIRGLRIQSFFVILWNDGGILKSKLASLDFTTGTYRDRINDNNDDFLLIEADTFNTQGTSLSSTAPANLIFDVGAISNEFSLAVPCVTKQPGTDVTVGLFPSGTVTVDGVAKQRWWLVYKDVNGNGFNLNTSSIGNGKQLTVQILMYLPELD